LKGRLGSGGVSCGYERLRECQTLLISVTLQVDSLDKRQWRPNPVYGYSVCDAYELLTSQEAVTLGDVEDLLWHKQVPLKVSIFACCLLRDRLPTKTNLVTWGILSPDLDTCVTGCATLSLRNTCSFLLAPLVHFGHSSGLGLTFRRRMHPVSQIILFSSPIQWAGLVHGGLCYSLCWLACVWVVWNERNLRVFQNTENSIFQLLDKVKLFSYRWLRTTTITITPNTYCWWSSPLTCMGID
jgi:hypothetical protein